MDLVTKGLSMAMDSLTSRYNLDGIDRWGKKSVSIDEALPPTAWQLEEFRKFRKRLEESSKNREKRTIKKIQAELNKLGLKKNVEKIRYLYDVGMGSNRIAKTLEIPKGEAVNCIVKYCAGKAMGRSHNSLSYEDALVLIKSGMKEDDDEAFRSVHI